VTSTRLCATAGCRWRSGHPSGLCWDCRTAQLGYLARLRQLVAAGMAAEYAAHPEWRTARNPQAEGTGPSPFRFFWADVIRKPCPLCGRPAAVGFDSPHDPGARFRRPAKCLACASADIRPAFLAESVHPGLRLVAGGAR
jgi:hypothetical protein